MARARRIITPAVVFNVGNDVSNASAEQSASSLVLQQLNDQRSAVSGVSLDEEAANMVQYQDAYSASAQVITTINDMMYAVIQMTTLDRIIYARKSRSVSRPAGRRGPDPAADQYRRAGDRLRAERQCSFRQSRRGGSLVQNADQTSQADQFERSIGSVQGEIQNADSALNSVTTALQQAITLGVEGANGTR